MQGGGAESGEVRRIVVSLHMVDREAALGRRDAIGLSRDDRERPSWCRSCRLRDKDIEERRRNRPVVLAQEASVRSRASRLIQSKTTVCECSGQNELTSKPCCARFVERVALCRQLFTFHGDIADGFETEPTTASRFCAVVAMWNAAKSDGQVTLLGCELLPFVLRPASQGGHNLPH
jgi:hypothetical protein